MPRLRLIMLVSFVLAQMTGPVYAAGHQLCINGHPAPRAPNVTYGGYRHATPESPCRQGELCCPMGTVRDHIIPLCAGGADQAFNVQCQEREESYIKDADERRLCEAMCTSLQDAIAKLVRKWGN
jgi:hypothetical protein